MKKVLLSIVAFVCVCTFVACSNGDYVANPDTLANESANPLNYLSKDQFESWTGTDALSMKVNGTFFNVDSDHVSWFLDTAGYDNIVAFTDAGRYHGIILRFKGVYQGNLYTFGVRSAYNASRYCIYYDSTDKVRAYSSVLGNVGELYLIQNDTLGGLVPRIKGKFYFQGWDSPGGKVVNVSEGWFNVKKFP